MARVELRPEDHLVHFAAPDLTLNLGAVGKGYALDCAGDVLRFYGVQRAVLHGGQSTILAIGAPPCADTWRFDIRDPRDRDVVVATISLRDAALSTSGSYRQHVEADGMQYGHILDPTSGQPARGVVAVWLVADTGAEADALSTAAFVMGCDRASALATSRPGLAFVMLRENPRDGASVLKVGLP
jgi:thiamine biosynthesis lipoprotein